MDPVSAVLAALSAGGGILSALGGRKAVDPNKLRQMFGPNAVTQDILDLFNNVVNSPYGQQALGAAAEQGQQFGRDVNANAARAGFGPGGGADSGSSIFATSAGQGAANSLQQGVRGDIYKSVIPTATQMVRDRMAAYLDSRANTPTWQQQLGGAVGNAAGSALASYTPNAATPARTTTMAAGAQPASSFEGMQPGGWGGFQYPGFQSTRAMPAHRGFFQRLIGRY